jgi:predicted permease
MTELRLAIRRLLHRPGATVASVAALAVGIGAAAATWTMLDRVLVNPLAVASPGTLVVVGERMPGEARPGRLNTSHLYPIYLAIRDSSVFESLAASGSLQFPVSAGGVAEPRTVAFANDGYFETLGVQITVGRAFGPADNQRGAPLAAVVSHRFWTRALEAEPDVVGRRITVADMAATVVGVAPRDFRGLALDDAPDLYLPMETVRDVAAAANNGWNYFAEETPGLSGQVAWIEPLAGRLRAGVSAGEAAARLNGLDLGRRGGGVFETLDVRTASIPEANRPGMARFAQLIGTTVGLLLAIACMTVAMLMLTRTEARRDEFAMRLALGATRVDLARSVAIEGAVLAVSGAVLAVPVAWWTLAAVREFELPGRVSIDLLDLGVGGLAIAVMAACAAMATMTVALLAGLFGSSASVAGVLRSRGGATPTLTRRRTRTVLVAAQVAVSLVLLAGAVLFARSVAEALSLNPGFETSRIATARVNLGPLGYGEVRATAFADDLADRLAGNPAIRSLSVYTSEGGTPTPVIDGERRQFPAAMWIYAIDERYFRTMGLPVVQGRDFADMDTANAPPVAIVSASFAKMLGDERGPLGRRISSRIGQPPPQFEIVGVVPDVVTSVTTLEPPTVYIPIVQRVRNPEGLVAAVRAVLVRAASDSRTAAREVTRALTGIEPALAPPLFETIDDRLAAQMSPQRFGAAVMGGLGAIALLLTALGMYVLSDAMASVRQREMGIRAALGATRRQLGGLVLSEGARLCGLGLLAGLGLAWLGAGTIRAFLFQVEPLDPLTLAAVSAGLLAIAMLVSLGPALRAARAELARVLREE